MIIENKNAQSIYCSFVPSPYFADRKHKHERRDSKEYQINIKANKKIIKKICIFLSLYNQ